MDRTTFYNLVEIDDIDQLDFLWNSLSGFTMEYSPGYYRVDASDVMRPDLISYKNYGTVAFWWIIMLVNDITNPFTDIVPGQILQIPNPYDIYNFQRKYRLRRSY